MTAALAFAPAPARPAPARPAHTAPPGPDHRFTLACALSIRAGFDPMEQARARLGNAQVPRWTLFLPDADRLIAALDAAGFFIGPMAPSPPMLNAWAQFDRAMRGGIGPGRDAIAKVLATRVWATLQAAWRSTPPKGNQP